jgi:hypothetical protein
MKRVIYVEPDKDGKLFITLFGNKYEIVVKEKPKAKKKEVDK